MATMDNFTAMVITKLPSIDHNNDDLIWVQNIIYNFQGIYGDWVLQERVLALIVVYQKNVNKSIIFKIKSKPYFLSNLSEVDFMFN